MRVKVRTIVLFIGSRLVQFIFYSKEATGVDPNDLRSTPKRPTMIMRELMKKSNHIGDKAFLKNYENLFKG